MRLIYLHGLDSDANAIKAQMVDGFCQENHPDIKVIRPDLNRTPDEVVNLLEDLIGDGKNTVLVGSSLGGYFATLMSDKLGVPAVLLNPSIRPDLSFRRFLNDHYAKQDLQDLSADTVIYKTTGGWNICYGDLGWFDSHRLKATHGQKLSVFLCLGDELLDAAASQAFYEQKGSQVVAISGGDHRISDFDQYVGQVIQMAIDLLV